MQFPQLAKLVRQKLIRGSLAIAALYLAAAKLGLTTAFTAHQVTLVWPPTGLALGVLVLVDFDLWPGVLLGAFLANLAAHQPPAVAMAVAAGNTLEAMTGAWLLGRFVGTPMSQSWQRSMLAVVVFGALASTMISATIGVISLCVGGLQPWSSFWSMWRTWWLGNAAGDLIVAPALLAFSARPRDVAWLQRLEIGTLVAGLSVTSVVVFARRFDNAVHYPLEYLVFPFLIWAAIRFGLAGAAFANLLTATIAIWGTARGFGPYASGQGDERLMLLQIFLSVVSSSGLLLGATVSDRDAARVRRAGMLEAALDCIISINQTGRIIEFNPAAERAFGYTRTQALGQDFADLIIPEHLREFHRRAIMRHHRLGDPGLLGRRFETVAVRADGHEFPIELSMSQVPAAGPPVFTAFIRDITEQKRLVKQLAFRATHDGLTNVLNNAAFMERLTLAARQANVGGRHDIAVLFVDLNKFKGINDRFGHIVGDRLLVAIARRLRAAVRPHDSVGRLGGDEFAVLLEHVTGQTDVETVVQRVQRAMDEAFNVDGQEICASVSVGIALASKDGPRPEDLLRAADSAMYDVKTGRGGESSLHG
ncbi:MAG TPA: MASE1 domain-containing protein [Vicinamibacterales bacterium]|nr:MASE1 domain-containing protein [Vicinamibacterales bacterium]